MASVESLPPNPHAHSDALARLESRHPAHDDKDIELGERNARPGTDHSASDTDVEKQEPHTEETEDELNKDGKINGRSKGKIAVIMLALCLAVFLAALDVTIITTALPTISEHFHSSSGYTWIGSAFLLANAASIPSWGKVSGMRSVKSEKRYFG